jgi:two-component system, OmpR family, heavy metal sensor histidine kinase CusS
LNRSLKWRLLGWTAGGMVLLLAVFAVGLYLSIDRALNRSFNDALASTAQTIATTVKQDKKKIEVDFDEQEMPEFHRARHPDYFQVWRQDGSVLKRSDSLAGQDLERGDAEEGAPVFLNTTLPDGRRGRVVVLVLRAKVEVDAEDEDEHPKDRKPLPPAEQVTLAVARETRPLDSQLASLRWLLGLAGGGTVLLVLLVSAIVVRQGLKPLGALADRIAAIREDDLSARVPDGGMPTEMAPVAARLNELLGRLEAAFERERAMTADVAHELRTPLAGMRSTIEVALSRSRNPAEYQEALRECQEIIRQTQGMTENLLALARLEGGQLTLRSESIGLAELLDTLWRPHAAQAQARGLTLRLQVPADLACTADREILSIAVSNLLANAAEYTNAGGRIEVTGRSADGGLEMVFSNTGAALTAADTAHLFDRFWRGDASRTAAGVHAGLGLSLVQRSVQSLGGAVAATCSGSLFTVQVTLPIG